VAGLRRLWTADRDRQPMPEGLTERLIVGPERARRQFTALVAGAQKSIRLIDAKLSDPELVSVLNARRAEGLTVELFKGKRVGDLKSHGKLLLLDDETIVVGSLALAALSLDFRREVAIVVNEPSAVGEAVDLFRTVRESERESRAAGTADGALC
jgi:phosphatidylserine/phosphatidylglycerophosphate/cardiolipin synthase-like enzyme